MPSVPYSSRPNPAFSASRVRPRSRQKACSSCVVSKARCNRERPTCARCRSRGEACEYPGDRNQLHDPLGAQAPKSSQNNLNPDIGLDALTPEGANPTRDSFGTISLRWLAALVPERNRTPARPKILSDAAIYYCCRYLRTYPLQLASSTPPPFVHPSQLHTLANATTLVNMFLTRAPGSDDLVAQTVMSEMGSIMSSYQGLSSALCLAAFQSYLVLTLLVYFHLEPKIITIETFLNLQALADRCARLIPLVRDADVSWSEYVQSESLRRTIFTTCVVDDVWNAIAGIPVFVAEELGRLPAPGPRRLWNASQADWQREWDAHAKLWSSPRLQADTGEPGLLLEELWGRGTMRETTREARVDQWVMDSDGFAGWVLAICEMGGSGRATTSSIVPRPA